MNQYFYLARHPSLFLSKPLFILLISLSVGCSSVKQLAVENDINKLLNQSPVFSNQFTGFSLYDIESSQYVASYNSTLKFTPASNTKLLTMYASLKTFGDSIPAIAYQWKDSMLLVKPLADPTFLYRPFTHQKAFNYLKTAGKVQISWPTKALSPYGKGWAWDDYLYDYQVQQSYWPIYGNSVSIRKEEDSLMVNPPFFTDYVEVLKQTRPGELVARAKNLNVFKAYLENDTSNFERVIPFEYSQELLVRLLADTLNKEVSITSEQLFKPDTIYSYPVDRVLASMLKPSNNFLAEQLLLMAALQQGFSGINPFIHRIKNTWLSSLNDLVWVDGSGLSRYNLIAPVDQVRLLKLCYDEFGWDRITSLLPAGGEGTLKDLYIPLEEDAPPYVFAKTGTLSNNHNLSGYLITRSGKRMIFSFMNNHYTKPTSEVKKEMERFILNVRNAY